MSEHIIDAHGTCSRLLDELERVIIGKREVLELVLMGILAQGHILLEDVPGVAKTLIARSYAQVVSLSFKRIQFTPDLLPADITGSYIYDQKMGTFDFRRGPVFTNLLLADEINRATPKTQAALLEAMQEGQVTVEEQTYDLSPPFIVIATQNPIDHEGTYPLPEAQLDRFILRTSVGYPTGDEENELLLRRLARETDEVMLSAIVDGSTLLAMQRVLEDVYVESSVSRYIVGLARATRTHPDVQVGASPRGALALLKLSRARALMFGRDFVTPEDVKAVTIPALAHRLSLRPELWVRRITGEDIVASVLGEVPAPKPDELQPR